ncbi:hypothetical protein [Wenzhouxiangella marina]|uniref:Uncharacterized protein n=1 Tax=Wenzhouxiangella marina TaxID=1579979 RepID=A0A0K0XZN9_9GAMM|nr:hypothetical protein [Wenzhouxiangella marina]AKS43153.1 hypothetical protein WM2015_2796 [Wenzhouxiangella marina]MBB6087162.1 hypothetical protein [Wenzhouxiangella marina]
MSLRTLACLTLLGLLIRPVSADELRSPHGVAIDPAAPHPSLLFSDLLKSMSDQVVWEQGKLRFFERVRFAFLPDFNDPQHIAAYNPNTGAFLTSQITDATGNVVQTVQWEARREAFPIWVGQAVNNSDPAPLAPGAYTATWTLDGQAFWAMDFELVASGGASPYEQGHYLLEGPWSEWAYVYVPNGNLSQAPTFNLFLRDAEARPWQWTDQVVVIEVYRNGELVAQHGHNAGASRPASIVQAKPWWVAHEFSLRSATDDGFVPASALTEAGAYEVRVGINGEPWGVFRYAADGSLPRPDRQRRGSDDPMHFLEGLTDRFYLQRVQAD